MGSPSRGTWCWAPREPLRGQFKCPVSLGGSCGGERYGWGGRGPRHAGRAAVVGSRWGQMNCARAGPCCPRAVSLVGRNSTLCLGFSGRTQNAIGLPPLGRRKETGLPIRAGAVTLTAGPGRGWGGGCEAAVAAAVAAVASLAPTSGGRPQLGTSVASGLCGRPSGSAGAAFLLVFLGTGLRLGFQNRRG